MNARVGKIRIEMNEKAGLPVHLYHLKFKFHLPSRLRPKTRHLSHLSIRTRSTQKYLQLLDAKFTVKSSSLTLRRACLSKAKRPEFCGGALSCNPFV